MAMRIEKDSFGGIEVPAERLWGAQTQRSLQNFKISTDPLTTTGSVTDQTYLNKLYRAYFLLK